MLQLTPEATRHLVRVRRERGLDDQSGARFVSDGAGVGLTFAEAPEPGDGVIEQTDISVFVAPEVADALNASVVDARAEDGKSVLVLRPQAASSARTD
jgi:Fe-S cluster assembly iron-binding protein IscA